MAKSTKLAVLKQPNKSRDAKNWLLTEPGRRTHDARGGSRKGSKGNAVRMYTHAMPWLPPQL